MAMPDGGSNSAIFSGVRRAHRSPRDRVAGGVVLQQEFDGLD
jgi:hypothetical protein